MLGDEPVVARGRRFMCVALVHDCVDDGVQVFRLEGGLHLVRAFLEALEGVDEHKRSEEDVVVARYTPAPP